jgi:hypothetical protein
VVNGDVFWGISARIVRQLDPEDVNTAILLKRREIFSQRRSAIAQNT